MTSEIDKLKHFHVENYSGTNFTDCVEVEISPDNWIMAVDINNIDLIKLDINYNIQWEECSCLKGIRLEDVTEELEDKAYEEMRHN